jgi:hypothetical protein
LRVLAVCAGLAGAVQPARATTFTVKNNCSYTVYPGIYPASLYANGGWSMAAGASVTISVPSGSIGRLWGRTGCSSASPAVCTTGSCGGTGLQCAGTTGVPNTSLFEWNVNASGTDWYDVSYVDAVDNPIGVQVSDARCVSPNVCSPAVITSCPADLKSGNVCLSPCTKYNTDQYCCRGAYGTAATCLVSQWAASAQTYVNDVHGYCPHSYAFAYDESSGALQTCPTGANYTVTFCPSGSAGGGGTTYALSVAKNGTGSGTVTSNPAGVSCGSTCSASFASGTAVTLTATPASGSTFAGWSGACTGTGSCSTTMTAARSVTATFNTSSGGGGGGSSGGGTTIGNTVISSTINSTTSVTFQATNVQWADVHYVVNNGAQLNVRMAQSGSTATYTITTAANAPVRYFVTFWGVGASGAVDSPWLTVR